VFWGAKVLYRAFISYSHESDIKLAAGLQHELQQFAKVWYQLRAIRVFRDKTGITPGQGLSSAIKSALDESEYFVLLASPLAARADWVRWELAHWLENKAKAKILIVLTEGEITWSREAGDFDWQRTDALPKSLAGVFEEEPYHLDLRWAKTDVLLSLANLRFREAVADLASVLHNIPRDVLDGDDVQQHKRALRLRKMALAAVAILTFAAVTAGILWYKQKNLAEHNAQLVYQKTLDVEKSNDQTITQSKIARSQELVRKISLVAPLTERLRLGIEAVETSPIEPAVHTLRAILAEAFEALETSRTDRSVMTTDALGRRVAVASPYGTAVVADLDDDHSPPIELCSGPDPIDSLFLSPNGQYLLVLRGSALYVWDLRVRQQVAGIRVNQYRVSRSDGLRVLFNVWFTPDSSAFIAPGVSSSLGLWALPSGRRIADLSGTERDDTVLFSSSTPTFLTYNATGPTEPSASMWTLHGKFLWRPDPAGLFWWAAFYKKGSGLIATNGDPDRLEVYTWTVARDGIPRDFQTSPSSGFDLSAIAREPGETFINVLSPVLKECDLDSVVATGSVVICEGHGPILYEVAGAQRLGLLPGWPFGESSARAVVSRNSSLAALEPVRDVQEKGDLVVWEDSSRKVLWHQPGVSGPVVFSDDNKRVIALNDGAPLAFEARSGKPIHRGSRSNAFTSPLLNWYEKAMLWTDREGNRLIARAAHDLCVWDLHSGQLLQHLNLFATDKQRVDQNRKALNRYPPEQLLSIARQFLQGCTPVNSSSAR
jgi:hypothetical protein